MPGSAPRSSPDTRAGSHDRPAEAHEYQARDPAAGRAHGRQRHRLADAIARLHGPRRHQDRANPRHSARPAREHAADYVRAAREGGHSWHDIGDALGLVPGPDAQQARDTIAEAAFSYAAGHPDTENTRRYGRSVTWNCHACDQAISDHGLSARPAEYERGHTEKCPRLAATIAAWDAEWEAAEADWEADLG
jgi:hypothetical protein